MKKLFWLACALGAVYIFKPSWLPSGMGTFAVDGNGAVTVFVFDRCGAPCRDVLSVLDSKGLTYEKIDLTNNREGEAKFRNMGAGNQLPVTFIGRRRVEGFQRTEFTHALAAEFGVSYLDSHQRRVVEKHFDTAGRPKVVMYGTSWCPFCKKARAFFTREGIAYTEIDVEKTEQGKRDYTVLQSSGYPLIYVGANRFEGLDLSGVKAAL